MRIVINHHFERNLNANMRLTNTNAAFSQSRGTLNLFRHALSFIGHTSKNGCQKDLHVLVTSDLKQKLEIPAVSTKAIKMLGFIRRSCVNISMTSVPILLYTQFRLVISHFVYCSQLRSPQSVSLFLKIERVQSCATKFILSLSFTSADTLKGNWSLKFPFYIWKY